jgi:hypothetical protein
MRFALLVSILAACTEPVPADGRFTLRGNTSDVQGLVLSTSELITAGSPQELGDADIYLSVRQVVQLRGRGTEGTFCSKGQVGDLAAIDPEHASCEWSYADLGANFPHPSVAAGNGYVVRDRFDDELYRLRIVDDLVDEANVATVVFDVEPLANAPAR